MSRIIILKYFICLSVCIFLIYLLVFPQSAYTATFNVINEDELREALSTAASNGEDDVINIGAGIYRTSGEPFIYNDTGGDRRALAIQGEGKGITILDGEETSRVLYIETPNDIFNMVTIKSLTIRNGFIEDFPDDGAGIRVTAQTFIVKDSEFTNNKSVERAGGISVNAIDITLENNIFMNNSAHSGGGGDISGNNIKLANNSFSDNVSDWRGGGLIISGDNVTLVGNIFLNNIAGSGGFGDGGGADIGGSSSVVISNNEFLNNDCASRGGGLNLSSTNLEFTNNRFIENSARLGGGGAEISSRGKATLSENIFTANFVYLPAEPDIGGGGVWIDIGDQDETDVVFTNNILTHNTSTGDGGAFFVKFLDCINQEVEQVSSGPRTTSPPTCPPTSEDNLVVTNNTFTLNSAGLNGGAISITETIAKDNITNVYNNIVYGNMGNGDGNDLYIKGGLVESDTMLKVNLFNNDFSDLFITCEGVVGCLPELNEGNNIDADPMFVDAEAGDFALMPDSACIDSGDPDAPDLPDDDIFGNPRGPIPDMGAVEYIAGAANNGGCSLTSSPATSSLSVFFVVPVLIMMRRIVKRCRK